jgi:hypothetical protein
VAAVNTGTCASPLRLFPATDDVAIAGSYMFSGDTTGQRNLLTPTCNDASDAPDQA